MMSNYYGNNDHYGSGGQGGGNYYGHNDHYGSGGQGGGNYYGNNDPYGSGGQGGGNRNNNKRGNSGGGYGNNNYNNYKDGNPYGQDRDRYNRGDNSNRMQWPRNSIQQEPHESPFPAPPSVKHDDEWKKREQNLQMLLQCSDQEKNYKEYMELSEEDKRRVFFKLPETIFQ